MQITKYTETMTPRERVRRTFNFEKTDRVAIGYETNPVIHGKLCEALGIHNNDYEALLRALGVDYRPIGAPYIGKPLHKVPENRMVDQLEGCIMRWGPNGSGGYWDFCDFPLHSLHLAAMFFPRHNFVVCKHQTQLCLHLLV
mgnify:CR=1 FL=1